MIPNCEREKEKLGKNQIYENRVLYIIHFMLYTMRTELAQLMDHLIQKKRRMKTKELNFVHLSRLIIYYVLYDCYYFDIQEAHFHCH